jgi:hypothetical protein
MNLYTKYEIVKTDGSDTDPEAEYFVLRIDTDRHARVALRAYANSIREHDPAYADDIDRWLDGYGGTA